MPTRKPLIGRVVSDARSPGERLAAAVLTKDHRVARRLLKQGVDPNTTDVIGRTPLHYAANYGNPTTVRILLDAGANPHIRDFKGRTPRELAIHHGKTINAQEFDRPPAERRPLWKRVLLFWKGE